MFIVRKSTKRSYGYELYWTGEEKLSWLLDGRRCGWYRLKRVAEHEAEIQNNYCKKIGAK